MISFIETINFKKLDTVRVDFTEGTNLILGDNGLGKTTVFNAIKFGFYGVSGMDSDKENIPTWGNKNCTVKVGVLNDFLVVRSLKDCKVYRADEDGSLIEDNRLKVAEGSTPCTLWIKDHYGLDSDMFDIFNMSLQGETGALITLGATKLNQLVENHSGVGVLDTVIKSLSAAVSTLKGAAGTYEYQETSELTSELVEYEADIITANKTLLVKTELLADARLKYKEVASTLKVSSDRNITIQKAKDVVAKSLALVGVLKPEIAQDEKSVVTLKGSISHITNVSDLSTSLQSHQSEIRDYTSANNDHNELTDMVEVAEVELMHMNSLTEREALVAEKLKGCEIKLETLLETFELSVDITAAAKTAYEEFKSVVESGACTKCHRHFENFDEENAKQNLDLSKSNLLDETVKYEVALKELTAMQDFISELPASMQAKEQAEDLNNQLASLKGQLQALEKRWADFDEVLCQRKIEVLSSDIDLFQETSKEIARLQKTVEARKLKLAAAECDIENDEDALGSIVDLQLLQEIVSEVIKDGEVASENVSEIKLSLASLNFAKGNHNSQLQEITAGNEKLLAVESDLDKHTRLIKYLRTTRTEYMGGVWTSILGAASGFINKTTQGWITEVGRNSTGKFTFTENGIVGTVKGDASGAQKEFIGVALRIGLGMALQGDRALLMLDEPTAGMTEANADKLANGLLNVNGQKIVITHRQSERLTAANIVNL